MCREGGGGVEEENFFIRVECCFSTQAVVCPIDDFSRPACLPLKWHNWLHLHYVLGAQHFMRIIRSGDHMQIVASV